MQRIISENAPEAIGPYVHGTVSGNLIITSGQVGIDPKTNKLTVGIENQTKQALNNLKNVIVSAGGSLETVLKVTIYLTDMNNFGIVNDIYGEFFKVGFPARTAIEVSKLPIGAEIEIEAIVEKNN